VRDPAGNHHDQTVGERARDAQVLLDQEQSDAFADERLAGLDEALDNRWRETL
jgi:hypothetical protein